MASDFSTNITIKGSPSDIRKALKMLNNFQNGEYYFESMFFSAGKYKEMSLLDFPDSKISEINANKAEIDACGPFGEYPEEAPVFQDLADEIPDAYFSGMIEGFDGLGSYYITKGVLSDGTLTVYFKTVDEEDVYKLEEDDEIDDNIEWDDKMVHSVKTVVLK